jgi:hypothetical protein
MVQYLHFRILKFPLINGEIMSKHGYSPATMGSQGFPSPSSARGKVRFSMTRPAGPEGALLLWLAVGKSRDSEAAFLDGFPLDSGNI